MIKASPADNKYYNKDVFFCAEIRSYCELIGFSIGAGTVQPADITKMESLLMQVSHHMAELSPALVERVCNIQIANVTWTKRKGK